MHRLVNKLVIELQLPYRLHGASNDKVTAKHHIIQPWNIMCHTIVEEALSVGRNF